jgi:lipoate-protein ligase A
MSCLEVLPVRTAGAAENMAVDFLLLQRYPRSGVARMRHYEWRRPAFTFGYSQKIAWVREQLPAGEHFDLCRRPTGGGIVDHRDDWTYSVVIPRGHPLEEDRAIQSYRAIHDCVAGSLCFQGVPAGLQPAGAPEPGESGAPGICFQRPELYDVVHSQTGAKIAGAAQKRNAHGLLFQGSIARAATGPAPVDWDVFFGNFAARLASALGCTAEDRPWPELDEDEVSGLVDRYSSAEWIEFR